MRLNNEERKILIELICNEQSHMIKDDHMTHASEKYKLLESLKIKVKEL